MLFMAGMAACALALEAPVVAQDTSTFRGGLDHGGVYGASAAIRGRVKWQFHTRGSVVSSPAVTGDTVYVGSNDNHLYAINAATGTQKWKFKTGSRVTSSPAVSGGVVYVASYDGNLYAVDAASGQSKWKFASEGERRFAAKHLHGVEPAAETMPDPFDSYLSSPAVWDGTVYFGSGDGNVYAVDATSGALRWKFHTGDVVHASPALSGGTLYIGSWDSYFYALDAATGKEKWRFKTGEDPDIHNQVGIQSSAAIADGVVYFGCRDSNLYAVDAQTGQKRWAYSNRGSWVIASPAVYGGKVYFATSDTGRLAALDTRTGSLAFSLDFKHWPMFSSPAISGGRLYIGSHQGRLIAVDLASNTPAWIFVTEASRQNGPALTKPDGTPNYEAAFADGFYDSMVAGVARMLTVGAVLSSPVVGNNVVYFGSTDGNLYALE